MIFPRKIQNIKKNAEGIFYPCLVAAISAQKNVEAKMRDLCGSVDASGAKFGASIELSKVETHRQIIDTSQKLFRIPETHNRGSFIEHSCQATLGLIFFAITKVIHCAKTPTIRPSFQGQLQPDPTPSKNP